MTTIESALQLWHQGIDHAGPYGVDPAYLFVGVLLAGTMVEAPPPGTKCRMLARLAVPSMVTLIVWVLGTLFRSSGHKPAGAIVSWTILGLAGIAVSLAPWIVWKSAGHRVLAGFLLAYQLCFTLSMSMNAAMAVTDDWT